MLRVRSASVPQIDCASSNLDKDADKDKTIIDPFSDDSISGLFAMLGELGGDNTSISTLISAPEDTNDADKEKIRAEKLAEFTKNVFIQINPNSTLDERTTAQNRLFSIINPEAAAKKAAAKKAAAEKAAEVAKKCATNAENAYQEINTSNWETIASNDYKKLAEAQEAAINAYSAANKAFSAAEEARKYDTDQTIIDQTNTCANQAKNAAGYVAEKIKLIAEEIAIKAAENAHASAKNAKDAYETLKTALQNQGITKSKDIAIIPAQLEALRKAKKDAWSAYSTTLIATDVLVACSNIEHNSKKNDITAKLETAIADLQYINAAIEEIETAIESGVNSPEAKKKLLIGYLIDTASSYLANDINKGKIWDELLIKLYDEAYTDIVLDLLNQTEDFEINSKIDEKTVTLAIKHSQVKAVESVLLSHVKNHHQKLERAATDYRATLNAAQENDATDTVKGRIDAAIKILRSREDESLKSYQSSLKSASKEINDKIENIKTQSKENPIANRFLAVIKIIGSFFTNGVSRTLKEINHTNEIHQSILFFGTAKHNSLLHYQQKIRCKLDTSNGRVTARARP